MEKKTESSVVLAIANQMQQGHVIRAERFLKEFASQELTEYKDKLKKEIDRQISVWPLSVDENINAKFVKELIDSL